MNQSEAIDQVIKEAQSEDYSGNLPMSGEEYEEGWFDPEKFAGDVAGQAISRFLELTDPTPKLDLDYKNLKDGDQIEVDVGGVRYLTVIQNNVQRFYENGVIRYLVDNNIVNLNDVVVAYHNGKFSKRDYAEFNMMLGYSVSGFCDLSSFTEYDISNPLWK